MGGEPDVPQTPLSQQVSWKQTGYTSWDQGKTYRQDPNKHFSFEGGEYYITPGADVNDRGSWQVDTMSGYHRTPSEQAFYQAQAEERRAQTAYQENVLSAMTERNRIMLEQLEQEKAKLEAERKAYEAKLKEEEEKRKKRLQLAARGRGTILTGGRGDESQAPLRRQTLGAV